METVQIENYLLAIRKARTDNEKFAALLMVLIFYFSILVHRTCQQMQMLCKKLPSSKIFCKRPVYMSEAEFESEYDSETTCSSCPLSIPLCPLDLPLSHLPLPTGRPQD